MFTAHHNGTTGWMVGWFDRRNHDEATAAFHARKPQPPMGVVADNLTRDQAEDLRLCLNSRLPNVPQMPTA